MNKYVTGMVVIITLLLCIGNASATMYEASIDVYKAEFDDDGNFTWGSWEDDLWIGESESETVCGNVEITFSEPSSSISYGMFVIKKSGTTDWIDIFPGEGNYEVIDIEDIRLKIVLNQIRPQTGTTGIISDDDSVVSIWIEPNSADKLGLSTGDIPNVFNPVETLRMRAAEAAENYCN